MLAIIISNWHLFLSLTGFNQDDSRQLTSNMVFLFLKRVTTTFYFNFKYLTRHYCYIVRVFDYGRHKFHFFRCFVLIQYHAFIIKWYKSTILFIMLRFQYIFNISLFTKICIALPLLITHLITNYLINLTAFNLSFLTISVNLWLLTWFSQQKIEKCLECLHFTNLLNQSQMLFYIFILFISI